jgi:hypothetical protein
MWKNYKNDLRWGSSLANGPGRVLSTLP